MATEVLHSLSHTQVAESMIRIPTQESYAQLVSEELSKTVIGQKTAMDAVARRVTLAESGMNDPDRPLSSMMFLGQTGVGKTETSHALSDYLFHDPNSDQLKIIDCQEFSEKHMILRLTGAPPSYVGYGDEMLITEKFLSQRNIIVFDEVEKAHPNFHRLLLGILESGRLKVKNGEPLNFANSHIILTSNVGASELARARKGNTSMGFGNGNTETADLDQIGKTALKKHFEGMPEFLGRLDEIVVFNDLEPEHYALIFQKFIDRKNGQLANRMQTQAPYFAVTVEARDHLLTKIDREYGARDIRGVIDDEIFFRASDLFMNLDLTGRPLVADVEEGNIVFYTDKVEEKLPENVIIFPLPEGSEKKDSRGTNPLRDENPSWSESKARHPNRNSSRRNRRNRNRQKDKTPMNEFTDELDYSIFQQ